LTTHEDRTAESHWRQAMTLLEASLDIEDDDARQTYLREQSRGDEKLYALVMEMVEASVKEDFLEPVDLGKLYTLELVPGNRVGDYEIIEQIGRGGMSTVYRAQRSDDPQPVAIKILNERFGHQPHRLARELAVLEKMDHPGILRFFDTGEMKDGSVYLVMEYIDGVSTLTKRRKIWHWRLTKSRRH